MPSKVGFFCLESMVGNSLNSESAEGKGVAILLADALSVGKKKKILIIF